MQTYFKTQKEAEAAAHQAIKRMQQPHKWEAHVRPVVDVTADVPAAIAEMWHVWIYDKSSQRMCIRIAPRNSRVWDYIASMVSTRGGEIIPLDWPTPTVAKSPQVACDNYARAMSKYLQEQIGNLQALRGVAASVAAVKQKVSKRAK